MNNNKTTTSERLKCLFLIKGNKAYVNLAFYAIDYLKQCSFLRAWMNRKGMMVEFELTTSPEKVESVLLAIGMQRGLFNEENQQFLATYQAAPMQYESKLDIT